MLHLYSARFSCGCYVMFQSDGPVHIPAALKMHPRCLVHEEVVEMDGLEKLTDWGRRRTFEFPKLQVVS